VYALVMEGGSAGNSNGGAGANPLREMYDEWTYKTPFVTRNSLIWIILMSDSFSLPLMLPCLSDISSASSCQWTPYLEIFLSSLSTNSRSIGFFLLHLLATASLLC
jgi:hypothetical protein